MIIRNVPEKFYKKVQKRFNFMGLSEKEIARFRGSFIEAYENYMKPGGNYDCASCHMAHELRQLKRHEYKINSNSIEIYKGVLQGLTIEDIKFIEEFNIKTIHQFTSIIDGTREYIRNMFHHIPKFVQKIFKSNEDVLYIKPVKLQ